VNGAWVILVGVIGEDAYSAIPLGERNGWIWHDPLRTINAIAAKFDEARVCVISHSGLKADRRLAELVTCDVLFSGHCHTNPPAPVRHSGTWIAQAPDHGRGTAEATFDGSTWRVEHNLLIEGHSSRSTGIGQQVERLSAEGNVVIGHVHPRWLRHPDRRALVLALAQRASQYSALPALLNETALRPGLLRGVLRRRDLLDLEPFNNRLVLLPLPDDGSAAIERMLASGLLPVSYGDIVVGSEFVTTSYLAANYFAGASGTTVCDLTDVLARVLIEGAG
jgi:2',3'-cyclic-nucleotide 2'-phosphodiesterase (5'-nucleotidase family)